MLNQRLSVNPMVRPFLELAHSCWSWQSAVKMRQNQASWGPINTFQWCSSSYFQQALHEIMEVFKYSPGLQDNILTTVLNHDQTDQKIHMNPIGHLYAKAWSSYSCMKSPLWQICRVTCCIQCNSCAMSIASLSLQSFIPIYKTVIQYQHNPVLTSHVLTPLPQHLPCPHLFSYFWAIWFMTMGNIVYCILIVQGAKLLAIFQKISISGIHVIMLQLHSCHIQSVGASYQQIYKLG